MTQEQHIIFTNAIDITLTQFKTNFPGQPFILTSVDPSGGHVHIPQVAINSMVPEVYDCVVVSAGWSKNYNCPNFYIMYNFKTASKIGE